MWGLTVAAYFLEEAKEKGQGSLEDSTQQNDNC